ncbi:hypothetical protein PAALTS15_13267 [Paenibacillus alvei TS-15]|uniref:Uncharacterized protein n=1 Tax=Paenibacillus alvei TS-15 TaxID=1117108 RepID=S9SRS8_PAEAL|nr:hypothetical protein PAALTS15_13267 [Paenibacillus alvei TS-15]
MLHSARNLPNRFRKSHATYEWPHVSWKTMEHFLHVVIALLQAFCIANFIPLFPCVYLDIV